MTNKPPSYYLTGVITGGLMPSLKVSNILEISYSSRVAGCGDWETRVVGGKSRVKVTLGVSCASVPPGNPEGVFF